MSNFSTQHPLLSPTIATIHVQVSQKALEERLIRWHQDFLQLVASVQADLNMELSRATLFDIVFLFFYTVSPLLILFALS